MEIDNRLPSDDTSLIEPFGIPIQKGQYEILNGILENYKKNPEEVYIKTENGLITHLVINAYKNHSGKLNLQGLTSLKYLDCRKNELEELYLPGLASLEFLNCVNNKLTELNLQGLSKLETLFCWDNHLTKLDLGGLASLMAVGCFNNKLRELNLDGLTNLRTLLYRDNQFDEKTIKTIEETLEKLRLNGVYDDRDCSQVDIPPAEDKNIPPFPGMGVM